MFRKIIPYPCDYKNTASVRRARRGGNIFVIILCVIIALLLGAGAFFALTNDGQGWKKLTEYASQYVYCPVCNTRETTPAPQAETSLPETQTPVPEAEEPAPEAEEPAEKIPAVTPAEVEPYLAAPFNFEEFEGIPDVVEAVTPGVVGILNYQIPKTGKQELKLVGSGSGFIYTENGYVITNQHVVEGAAKLKVSLHSGDTVDAILIGADVQTDVAVLRIESAGLKALPIGDSSKMRVGEFVLAIGDPISANELSGSVTFGIVSALSRRINIEGFVNEYMQTDAAVNPGNSGGPLINMRGEVIGVTSAKYISAGVDESGQNISSEGIGFALPINNVVEIASSLIENGSTVRPGIGITIVTYLEPTALIKTPGVYIYSVTEGGPAEEAGIKAGDRLVGMNGVEMTQDEFVEAIRATHVGDTITLTVERSGETLEINVVVGDMNQIHK